MSNKAKLREGTAPQLHLQYMADSAEQIAESIDRTGLRDRLGEVFQVAIARARRQYQKQSGDQWIDGNEHG